jgi:hypothetical protein
MLRGKASPGIWSRLAALFISLGLFVLAADAGNPVTVQLYSGVSNPIYVSAGAVTINFSYFLAYGGKGVPVGDDSEGVRADSLLIFSDSGNLLATLPISGDPAFEHEGSGTMTWTNPVGQFIKLGGDIYSEGFGNGFSEWWYLPGRPSVATGGDAATPPTGGIATQPQPPQTASLPPNPGPTNIHAVVISGLSDPAKVIASPNVTLTGGLVALGKANAAGSTVSAWSPGLRILPDYELLTGTKIPPVTPNIIDVRIVRQQVQADFPSAGQRSGD